MKAVDKNRQEIAGLRNHEIIRIERTLSYCVVILIIKKEVFKIGKFVIISWRNFYF